MSIESSLESVTDRAAQFPKQSPSFDPAPPSHRSLLSGCPRPTTLFAAPPPPPTPPPVCSSCMGPQHTTSVDAVVETTCESDEDMQVPTQVEGFRRSDRSGMLYVQSPWAFRNLALFA